MEKPASNTSTTKSPEAKRQQIEQLLALYDPAGERLASETPRVPILYDDIGPSTEADDLRHVAMCLSWRAGELRRQLRKAIGLSYDDASEEETEAAKTIKAEVVKALSEMLPQAKRAAKRGRPALLRLIVRTIRTKL